MEFMAKEKPRKPAKKAPAPSRKEIRYLGIPRAWYEELEKLALEQDRSISWMGRQAVRKFLEGLGRLPAVNPRQ